MSRLATSLLLFCGFTGCLPDFEDTNYFVAEQRVLAVRGIPAEAAPNAAVRYEALIGSPDGSMDVMTQFAYCTEARSAEERQGITKSCLMGENLVPIPETTEVPSDACARFGPNTPPSTAGEPARRPSDPDPSGGYYLPIRASTLPQERVHGFGLQRLRCDLAGATREIFESYQERYRNNRHPEIAEVSMASSEQAAISLAQLPVVWTGGRDTVLLVQVRRDSFEDYVVYSANDAALFDRREELTIHWYVSGGQLETPRQTLDERTRRAQTRWTLPADIETLRFWVIVQDSRGGSSWAEFEIRTDLFSDRP